MSNVENGQGPHRIVVERPYAEEIGRVLHGKGRGIVIIAYQKRGESLRAKPDWQETALILKRLQGINPLSVLDGRIIVQ